MNEHFVFVRVPLEPLALLVVLVHPQIKPHAEDVFLTAVKYLGDRRYGVFIVKGHTPLQKQEILHSPSLFLACGVQQEGVVVLNLNDWGFRTRLHVQDGVFL